MMAGKTSVWLKNISLLLLTGCFVASGCKKDSNHNFNDTSNADTLHISRFEGSYRTTATYRIAQLRTDSANGTYFWDTIYPVNIDSVFIDSLSADMLRISFDYLRG